MKSGHLPAVDFNSSNLFLIKQYIWNCLDRQGQMDVIYTDFVKAFDR